MGEEEVQESPPFRTSALDVAALLAWDLRCPRLALHQRVCAGASGDMPGCSLLIRRAVLLCQQHQGRKEEQE